MPLSSHNWAYPLALQLGLPLSPPAGQPCPLALQLGLHLSSPAGLAPQPSSWACPSALQLGLPLSPPAGLAPQPSSWACPSALQLGLPLSPPAGLAPQPSSWACPSALQLGLPLSPPAGPLVNQLCALPSCASLIIPLATPNQSMPICTTNSGLAGGVPFDERPWGKGRGGALMRDAVLPIAIHFDLSQETTDLSKETTEIRPFGDPINMFHCPLPPHIQHHLLCAGWLTSPQVCCIQESLLRKTEATVPAIPVYCVLGSCAAAWHSWGSTVAAGGGAAGEGGCIVYLPWL